MDDTFDSPETFDKQSCRKSVFKRMTRHQEQVTMLVEKRDGLRRKLAVLNDVSQLAVMRQTVLRWSFEEAQAAKNAVLAYEDTRRKAAQCVKRRIEELNEEIGEMANVVQDLNLIWDSPADDVQSDEFMQTSLGYWMDEHVEYVDACSVSGSSSGVDDSDV